MSRQSQQGSFMLEALIGIMIFFVGILTMIMLQANSIAIQNDSQYRTEAGNLVDQILGQINLNSRNDPSNPGAVNATTLASFSHYPTGGTSTCKLLATDPLAGNDCCSFTGAASTNPVVTNWVGAVSITPATRLPGSVTPNATTSRQQIVVNAANNQVTVTVCWQGPNDGRPRHHRVIGYVN